MANSAESVWTDGMSMLFTSFHAWTPEPWGCVNRLDEKKGRTRRDNPLLELLAPYVTSTSSCYFDPAAKGLTTGFMLVSYETGEDAMKHLLAQETEHLGSEFFLAAPSVINEAWKARCEVARMHEGDQLVDA